MRIGKWLHPLHNVLWICLGINIIYHSNRKYNNNKNSKNSKINRKIIIIVCYLLPAAMTALFLYGIYINIDPFSNISALMYYFIINLEKNMVGILGSW